jgi:hypothetical protein
VIREERREKEKRRRRRGEGEEENACIGGLEGVRVIGSFVLTVTKCNERTRTRKH